MARAPTRPANERARQAIALVLLIAYGALGIAGAMAHHATLSLASVAALLLALALLMLHRRKLLSCALWLVIAVPIALATAFGHAELALAAVPVVGDIALAWLFAHTLARGREPLVARIIRVIDGAPRLALPGVARYARQVTWYWTILLGAQALWLLVLFVCMVPNGALAVLGLASPWPVAAASIAWYTHAGAWLVPIIGMALEYVWRRWHLRHIPQLGARDFLRRLITCWPQLGGPSP